MTVISTNVNAMFAQNTLASNSRAQASAMQQLSTGNRVNSAKDDAAGLAIGQNMTSQVRGLNQAVKNANDGISMLQTADGAMSTQSDMLQRMRELAVQSASGTFSNDQRAYLNTEFKALTTQIDKVSTETLWNGKSILTGTAGDAIATPHPGSPAVAAVTAVDAVTEDLTADPPVVGVAAVAAADAIAAVPASATTYAASATGNTFTLQTGQANGNTTAATIKNMGSGASGLDIEGANISTLDAAKAAIDTVSSALDVVNKQRADIGAVTNQLTYAADNMTNISSNVAASRSQIMDTDYAQSTTQLAKTQIIAQAATAMLAQANQQPQSVLALLK